MLEDLEKVALGELNLSPQEFGDLTIMEVDALAEGYSRRQNRLEDLFILYNALPTYRGAFGNKAPSYAKLTQHRQKASNLPDIDEDTLKLWQDIQQEVNKK